MTLHATSCPLDCPDACGVLVETDANGELVSLRGNPEHTYSRGALCGKTAIYADVVRSSERLTVPLIREDGELREATWDDALARIAERVGGLAGADILALNYAGNMGVASRKYPMRVMNALGATETDGAICDATAEAGFAAVMGHINGPDIETIGDSDLVILWGVDARRTLQHTMPRLRELCRRGVEVIAVDIYRTDTIRTLEKWGGRGIVLQPGTDAALALALSKLAFDRRYVDLDFLRDRCHGGAEFRTHVAAYDLESAAKVTGLKVDAISHLADAIGRAERPFIKLGIGWTRRRNGGNSMRAVCSMTAAFGISDRAHFQSSDHFGLTLDVLDRPDLRPNDAPTEPIHHVEVGRELCSGRFKAVFVWGHNPAATVPDARRVRAGLMRDDLFLCVHEQFMTETARLADVVLPATTFIEHSDIWRSYGHRVLQYGKQAVDAPHEQRSNVATFSAIGRVLGLSREVWDVTEEGLCRAVLEASRDRIGDAFEDVLAGKPTKMAPREFADQGTPSGRIELVSADCERAGAGALASYVADDGAGDEGAFWLIPAPSVATHNSTYSFSSRHMQRAGEPVCWLNEEDADAAGVADEDRVELSNRHGTLLVSAKRTSDMGRGALRIDGFPLTTELADSVGVNGLVGPSLADLGGGSVQFSTRVNLRKL